MELYEAVDPTTGRTATVQLSSPLQAFFEAIRDTEIPDGKIKRTIDNLDISADAKALLYNLSRTAIVIGEKIMPIGRKILDYAVRFFAEYPNAGFGLVLGAVAAALFTAIPGLGQLLGPLISPILVFLGFLAGAHLDFRDKLTKRKVAEYVAEQNAQLWESIDTKINKFAGNAQEHTDGKA